MKKFIYETLLKLKAMRIRRKNLRNRYKRINMTRFYMNRMREARWGVSYSVFDGVELLKASLTNIRPHVNYINVVYQDVSWYGEPSPEPLLPMLEDMQKEGLIDKIIFYEPDLKLTAGTNERLKRNIGLEDAKKNGVEYYMSMDVDEFYIASEMEAAKYMIIKKQITRACVKQELYGSKPTQKLLYNINSFVPFFSRINRFSTHSKDPKLPCLCDPNRQLNHQFGSLYYVIHKCSMHHMSIVRKDIKGKMRNSSGIKIRPSGKRLYPKPSPFYTLCADVENWFNITI